MSKLANKEYREAYVDHGTRIWIARQIRVLRQQRGWTQAQMGARMGKPHSTIARLENPDYGRLTIRTLLSVAAAFDLGLTVRFVPLTEWQDSHADKSNQAMMVSL